MKTFNKILLQLLLLIGLTIYSVQKSTLKAKDITQEYCESDLNRYSFILQCELKGSLSQSMFRNMIIKSNDYQSEIKCEIPEISDTKGNYETIEIPCHIKNFQNGYLSFRFQVESDELELYDFNYRYFYLSIQCQQTITLVFGDIIDQECKQYKFYPNYFYKITILNETIPKDIYHNFYLQPKIVKNQNDSDDDIYVSCYLHTDDNNYFSCTIDFNRKLEATIYYEKDYIFLSETNKYKIIVKNQNRDLYINQNINCILESEVDFLNILKGNCKNGVFFFSIDFSSFGDNDNYENKEVYSKLLFEFKAKVDSKIYKNYCYLDNKNEDNKYDISKYKFNCAITSFELENFTYQNLFSGFYLYNYGIKELVYNYIYCYTSQNYITPFYYYYDICSNNNTFKILAVTNFNNDIFNVALNDTIEIPIISPFESIAICKLSTLQLEPYIEFNCEINGSKIIDYNNIFFGNVTTEAYIENMELIKFGGFEGIKNFGKYCSDKGSKCTQLIEKDYGINSMNKNNPKVYEYSFCLTSDDNSIFNKDNYNILFNNNSIVNCSIKNKDIVSDNSTESKVKCLIDNEILDEYPLLKNFNPINFTFYNNIFKNINEFAKYFQDILEIDNNSIIEVNKVKYYHCLNNNSILLKLKANITKANRYNPYIEYYFGDFGGFKYQLYTFFFDYAFNNILSDNSMNITFFDYNGDYPSSSIVNIECVINGDFSHENNIIIENDFYYKVFFNNFTVIWNNKTLLENIKCDNNDRLIFYDFNNINLKSFRIISYSLYDFDFYDNNGQITDYLLLNVKINGIMAKEKAICSISFINHYNSIIQIDLYCEIYAINIEFNDIITLEECDETIIKTLDDIELKIEGLDKFYYKYQSSEDKTISIYYNIYNNKDGEYCNQNGFFFNLTYYLDNPLENNDNIIQYSINNLINPINNEIIEGNCSFIKNDDYYYYNQYNLFCQIYSDLLGVPYLIINNSYLDKKNKCLL